VLVEVLAGADAEEEAASIMAAEVAAAWATSVGCTRMVGQVTPVPTTSREVAWARAPITLHTSGLWPWASVHGWKWSEISANSKPCSSASTALRTRSLGANSSLDSL